MVEMVRFCPDCGWNRLFEQRHTVAGRCPDSADGCCPEWCCTDCGAALLARFTSLLPEVAPQRQPGRRVA
jgi:hypothetical protein